MLELNEIKNIKHLTLSQLLWKYWGKLYLSLCQASQPSGLPRPQTGFLRAFPLAGGEGPASCPLCRVLLVGQRWLPPTPIPADRQLVPLTRAGRKAHARCRARPAGTKPVPFSTSCLRSTWLKLLLNCRTCGLGFILSVCISSFMCQTGRHLCFPKPKLLANDCLPTREKEREG